eukprot:3646003-Pyramimonas_sp.AAC.1
MEALGNLMYNMELNKAVPRPKGHRGANRRNVLSDHHMTGKQPLSKRDLMKVPPPRCNTSVTHL